MSTGDLLRAERDSGSPEGEKINKIFAEGGLVPGEMTIMLMKKAMEKQGWNKKKFLIDGFPRSQDNIDNWNKILKNDCTVVSVLYLECSEEAMIARIAARGEAAAAAGEAVRVDDNVDTLKKRFATFREQSMPMVEKYKKEGILC